MGRPICGLLVAIVALAGCSASEQRSSATTLATSTTSTSTSTSTSTTSTTSTSTTSTTTAAPTAAQLACDVLTAAPFLTRRDVVGSLVDRGGTAAMCGDALAATEQAMAIAAASATLDGSLMSSSIDLSCQAGAFSAVITNPFPVAIGFTGIGIVSSADGTELAQPNGGRIIWSIPPGEQRLVVGPLVDNGQPECRISGVVFLADDPSLPGDAGLPPAYPAVTPDPDDPASWLPMLLERELAAQRAGGDPALVPLYEDVRSASFATLTDPAQNDGSQLVSTDLAVRVCGEVDRRGGQVALVFEQTRTTRVERTDGIDTDLGPGGGLWLGTFRLGQDGLWRWLGSARQIPNPDVTTCEAWASGSP